MYLGYREDWAKVGYGNLSDEHLNVLWDLCLKPHVDWSYVQIILMAYDKGVQKNETRSN